jgi:hypothetical protein
MAQPQVARITCSQCNGWYNSESELRDHMQSFHRRFVSEQGTFQQADAKPDRFEIKREPHPTAMPKAILEINEGLEVAQKKLSATSEPNQRRVILLEMRKLLEQADDFVQEMKRELPPK